MSNHSITYDINSSSSDKKPLLHAHNKKGKKKEGEESQERKSKHKYAHDPRNTLKFSRNQYAKYLVVDRGEVSTEDHLGWFVETRFFNGDELQLPQQKPKAIINVIGGSKYYETNTKQDLVVKRGFIKAAQSLGAWIIDGGTHAGVMKYVGSSIKNLALSEVPCIGIAPLKKIVHSDELGSGVRFDYDMTTPKENDTAHLDPNHTHFILVNSEQSEWGEETEFLNNLRVYLHNREKIPIIVVVINGGGITLEAMIYGLAHDFPTIIVAGSGRASDAVIALIRCVKKYKIPNPTCEKIAEIASEDEIRLWKKFVDQEEEMSPNLKGLMNYVLRYYAKITIFDLDDEEDDVLDVVILKKYLSVQNEMDIIEKIKQCIMWGDRADLVQGLLIAQGALPEGKNLNEAMPFALIMDRPNIFEVLCENHARFTFPLRMLYSGNREVLQQLARGHIQPLQRLQNLPDRIRDYLFLKVTHKRQEVKCPEFDAFLDILAGIGPVWAEYVSLCSNFCDTPQIHFKEIQRLEFIDLLMWAIFVNRMELAKVIWKRTKFHVHSAVMACTLYHHLAPRAARTSEYLENAAWFENEAIRILNTLNYDTAKETITFRSKFMLGEATLEHVAAEGECKAVIAHPHFQQHIDEVFSSYGEHGIHASINTMQLIFDIITYVPRCIVANITVTHAPPAPLAETELSQTEKDVKALLKFQRSCDFSPSMPSNITKEEKETMYLQKHPEVYFKIPVVKFWTTTLFYVAFLVLQSYVLVNLRLSDIHESEYILWGWLGALLVEEFIEFSSQDGSGYFSRFTNKIDLVLAILNLAYIALRIADEMHPSENMYLGAANCLLASCLISWLRIMAIFPISPTFGPLVFILVKLFTRDFVLWSVLFSIFAVSFQIGFTSLALQAHADPLALFPDGGIFPVSLVAIIGQWDYLLDMLHHTPTGVICISIYTFIVQVMLVNLLIAMMGDTYSSMRENSDTEWKFYRYTVLRDSMAASALPPPLNILHFPIWVFEKLTCKRPAKQQSLTDEPHNEEKVAKLMRVTVDKLAEKQEKEESQSAIVQIAKTRKAISLLFSHFRRSNSVGAR